MPSLTVYAGTAVQVTMSFKNPAGVLTDPDTVTLDYTPFNGETTSLTYADSELTRVSTGVYTATVDTTTTPDFLPGVVSLWAIGTGICAVTTPGSFIVRAGPPAPPG